MDEILRRQVHPIFYDPATGLNVSAFNPSGSHEYRLSTLHGYVDPLEAAERHISHGLQTRGTWGIAVGEAVNEQLECLDDGVLEAVPDDHVSVDFRPLQRAERKRAARVLRDAAQKRDCLHWMSDIDE